MLDDGVEVRGVDRFSDYYDAALKRANLAPWAWIRARLQLRRGRPEPARRSPSSSTEWMSSSTWPAQPGVRASWGREFEIYLDDNLLRHPAAAGGVP